MYYEPQSQAQKQFVWQRYGADITIMSRTEHVLMFQFNTEVSQEKKWSLQSIVWTLYKKSRLSVP